MQHAPLEMLPLDEEALYGNVLGGLDDTSQADDLMWQHAASAGPPQSGGISCLPGLSAAAASFPNQHLLQQLQCQIDAGSSHQLRQPGIFVAASSAGGSVGLPHVGDLLQQQQQQQENAGAPMETRLLPAVLLQQQQQQQQLGQQQAALNAQQRQQHDDLEIARCIAAAADHALVQGFSKTRATVLALPPAPVYTYQQRQIPAVHTQLPGTPEQIMPWPTASYPTNGIGANNFQQYSMLAFHNHIPVPGKDLTRLQQPTEYRLLNGDLVEVKLAYNFGGPVSWPAATAVEDGLSIIDISGKCEVTVTPRKQGIAVSVDTNATAAAAAAEVAATTSASPSASNRSSKKRKVQQAEGPQPLLRVKVRVKRLLVLRNDQQQQAALQRLQLTAAGPYWRRYKNSRSAAAGVNDTMWLACVGLNIFTGEGWRGEPADTPLPVLRPVSRAPPEQVVQDQQLQRAQLTQQQPQQQQLQQQQHQQEAVLDSSVLDAAAEHIGALIQQQEDPPQLEAAAGEVVDEDLLEKDLIDECSSLDASQPQVARLLTDLADRATTLQYEFLKLCASMYGTNSSSAALRLKQQISSHNCSATQQGRIDLVIRPLGLKEDWFLGRSPLHLLVSKVRTWGPAGDQTPETPLPGQQRMQLLQLLLDIAADENRAVVMSQLLDSRNRNNATPWFTACHFCEPEALDFLIAQPELTWKRMLVPTKRGKLFYHIISTEAHECAPDQEGRERRQKLEQGLRKTLTALADRLKVFLSSKTPQQIHVIKRNILAAKEPRQQRRQQQTLQALQEQQSAQELVHGLMQHLEDGAQQSQLQDWPALPMAPTTTLEAFRSQKQLPVLGNQSAAEPGDLEQEMTQPRTIDRPTASPSCWAAAMQGVVQPDASSLTRQRNLQQPVVSAVASRHWSDDVIWMLQRYCLFDTEWHSAKSPAYNGQLLGEVAAELFGPGFRIRGPCN